ncbi:ribonucleases P/MRP protein subunit POP1-domain-containing protein [Ampelomyces quisqualis]|uniref:SAGA-associated factor 11 n=1 Tax=Ampelomyces quisqualis TaxID=50730 RepID=A0A6A5QN10_AMPQU|nr:ribonucleases P/MRP protein subunit POP1-domain-containing protein [Ampelomyces quisqualis]
MADQSKKRKPPSDAGPQAKRPRFPMRPQHHISAQPTRSAYPNGEVNVKNFLKSHENEIKSLEHAMRAARKGLSRRAFQDVPRELRRRTASHNPQRVPKRLRGRARQEAREDNTPIVRGKSGSGVGKGGKGRLRKEGREKSRQRAKGRTAACAEAAEDKMDMDAGAAIADTTAKKPKPKLEPRKKPRFPALATPATPPSRFRRRQKDKTWLPTHIWHSKRARMTEPKDTLWRFAIPLQPVMKSYRLTHRAVSQRGAVAWDMSYMSTISLEGAEASITGMLKGLHFCSNGPEDPWQDRGRAKKWRHGTRAWEGWIHEREAMPLKKIAQVTILWCVAAADSKKRKLFIRVHPSAFLQLWNEVIRVSKIQKPSVVVEDVRFEVGSIEIMGPAAAETLSSILTPAPMLNTTADAPQSIWPALAATTDVGSLPKGAMLAFDISDPRFRDPPTTTPLQQDQASLDSLLETLSQWPVDSSQGPSRIFDRTLRLAAQRAMPSQKSINRRKSECTLGEVPEPKSTDACIPALVHVSREQKSWTILLPWKCVPAVWRGISRYPVSSGGNPRFGGLKERRQVSYERSVPLFPFDHPGTDAGWEWELRQREVRKHEWTKRPKGKRIEWSTIDLGHGRKGELGDPWACDWDRLAPKPAAEPGSTKNQTSKEKTAKKEAGADATGRVHSPFLHLASEQATDVINGDAPATEYLHKPYLFTVKMAMIQRGVPADCSRVYRLPAKNDGLRSQWLSLLPRPGANRTRRHPEGAARAGEDNYPVAPDEDDLMGFVTTGNFNLGEGLPTAIGNLALHRVLGPGMPRQDGVCIVRAAGSTVGRLATWEVSAVGLSREALVELTAAMLDDVLHNIISSTVLSCHRAAKLLRMQSAATQAESLALATLEPPPPPQKHTPSAAAAASSIPVADTPAATYENGTVFLKGNPLHTTPHVVCPHCKLPRLMHPIMGKGMQPPDLTREYCLLYPWVQRPGHDVYGNPFPTDMAKSKKERELIKQQQKTHEKESVGTPGSQDTDLAAADAKEIKLNTGGKPASYIPWHTCPNCKRSLLITRFAQHLEKCLGITGRQSSRNAMAKLTAHNGPGSGMGNTPLGSRMGTPVPAAQDGLSSAPVRPAKNGKGVSPVKKTAHDDADADELAGTADDTPEPKKIKKKSSYVKKGDRPSLGGSSGSLKVKLKTGRPDMERRTSEMSERSDGKRDRDDADDGGDVRKKKKLKLSVGKTENGRARGSESLEPAD